MKKFVLANGSLAEPFPVRECPSAAERVREKMLFQTVPLSLPPAYE